MRIMKTAKFLVFLEIMGTAWAVPEVSNVRMAQRDNSRIVDIWYNLTNEEAYVTLNIETNGVAIPDCFVTRVTGDVAERIQPGTDKKMTWNAGIDWPENLATNAQAKVTAWATNNPPPCLVVDLFEGSAATRYPVAGYPSVAALPYGGVTNDLYKTTRLVLRRIPAGLFVMGSPSTETVRFSNESLRQVTLTQDYYIGVFEVTQKQWERVMTTRYSYWNNEDCWQTRPMEQVSYDELRGTAAQGGAGWPTNRSVYGLSFLGKLQTKTGITGLDLPTDAQWEYACRAGTTGALNDGTVNLTSTTSDARLDALGRYAYNGGKAGGTAAYNQSCGDTNATAKVGSYPPNSWGLYDMHGNVWEWCLDWFVSDVGTASAVDPSGPTSGSSRALRGGSWNDDAQVCRSARRAGTSYTTKSNTLGVRLSWTLP